MITFWRNGFGPDTSWDVHNAPSGDYRITIRRGAAGRPSPKADEFWMKRRISEIVHFAAPHTLFSLDSRVVQDLLDIHAAACPLARNPSARALLRERRFGAYLRTVGDDLAHAVSQRRLHIERLERPRPFVVSEEQRAHPTTPSVRAKAEPVPSNDLGVGTRNRAPFHAIVTIQKVIERVKRYLQGSTPSA